MVREAEIQLRRPCLHLIPLELRTPSPCPITLVSLEGRLPNLHRLHSPVIQNDSWILRMRRLTDWKITVFKCNKSSDHADRKTTVMPNTLWALGVLGFVLARILSQKLRRWVAHKRQKSYTNSEQSLIYDGRGVAIYSQVETRHDLSEMTLGHWGTNTSPMVRFQTHATA